MGVPLVDKLFEMPMMNIFEIEDGKIKVWKEFMNWKILEDMSKE